MEIIQDRNSRSGVIGTILVHMLLLLLFIQFGMPYQDPPPENEGGMIINFGTSDEGTGETQSSASSSASESVETSESQSSNLAQEEVLTQDNVESIKINSSTNPIEKPKEIVVKEPKPKPSDALLDALKRANTASTSKSGGDGETGNPGDQGDPNGDPNSRNYTGGGVGNGIKYSLVGRGKVSFKKPDNPTQEDGTVVVDIVVDRNGKVIKAIPGARGSTTTNPILYRKAKEAAMQARFSKKLDSPIDQKGTMTFIFILN